MKIVIFGAGAYYERRKKYFIDKVSIVSFIDNDPKLWGTKQDGILIQSPEFITRLEFDQVVLMSLKATEMRRQLLDLSLEEERIKYYDEFYAQLEKGKIELYFDNYICEKGKRVFIATDMLEYQGSPLAAVYMAKALQAKGYQVILAAAAGKKDFIEDIIKNGFSVFIYSGLQHMEYDKMFWLKDMDYIIANSYFMTDFVKKISRKRRCIWWLHEPKTIYVCMFERYGNFLNSDLKNLDIYAVSDVARRSFEQYYYDCNVNLLTYGIPDKGVIPWPKGQKKKLVFAVIGYVSNIKGQDIFVEAVRKLDETERKKAEFWIIGNISDNSLGQGIKQAAQMIKNIKILGELNRREIEKVYQDIDVVVCSSREETMSIVMTEGMMYGKVCITTDKTGIAQYIEHGKNGFVCTAENIDGLCFVFQWILKHKGELEDIGKQARLTYEKFFSMEVFGNRIEKALTENH